MWLSMYWQSLVLIYSQFSVDYTSTKATAMSPPASPPQDLHRQIHSTNQSALNNQSILSPKNQEELPAFRFDQEKESVPESIPERAERAKPEPQIITLKPTTYTPSPSPSRTPILKEKTAEDQESPPLQPTKRNSLRNRFSLKRKSPVEVERSEPAITSTTILTPPTSGQGPDSAYFSDNDKFYVSGGVEDEKFYVSGGVSTPTYDEKLPFPASPQPPYASLTHRPSLPRMDSDSSYKSIGSLGSETRPHLRPVNANPNSPLQRPWTAAPDDRRAPPSRMGMSTMSEMTSMSNLASNEHEKKPKKKKSAFTWLRKAFSLSDEEKVAFQARRRAPPPRPEEEVRPLFLDGKRIRDGHVVIRNGRVVHYREGTSTRASSAMMTREDASTRASTRQQQR